uniref:Serine/threonine-protein kinase PLK n=1 Tax=Strongyloides papillosus TaxID=174720 RepID=A0A0N5BIZ4_STREA
MRECMDGFDDILPTSIVDYRAEKEYIIEELIGEGGFGRCYKLIRADNNKFYAGKIIKKEYPYTGDQRRQVHQEARIHYHLDHPNIVRMYTYMSDDSFYYLVLGFCGKNTLRMYQKEKVVCSIPETKYFVKEIAQGISYLHSNKIIHRDMKLNNIFLTDNMDVKIGDFGLATVVSYPGEKITQTCGTPNYTSPEVLSGEGYSFGVDVWGLGCILYTLLVGKIPFDGECKDRILDKIMNFRITFPMTLDNHSTSMIRRLLTYDPRRRPNIREVLKSDYLNKGLIGKDVLFPSICKKSPSSSSQQDRENEFHFISPRGCENVRQDKRDLGGREDLRHIYQEISKVFKDIRLPVVSRSQMEGAIDYKNKPMSFVSKWCDSSDKYGLGYQLSDSSIGGVFNDKTLMVHREDWRVVNLCVDKNGNKQICHNCWSYGFEKQNKIIKIYKKYFNDVDFMEPAKVKDKYKILMKDLPYVTSYKKSNKAIGFLFSDKSLQVNFFEDHIKVIVSPLMGTISIIDKNKQLKTYNMKKLSSTGWDLLMAEKMYYIKSFIDEWTSLKRKLGGDVNNIPVKARFNNRG